jgi:hypothetical protein
MAACYESVRHDRRYEVDARGVAEFDRDGILKRFIPWYAVKRLPFAHGPADKRATFSVRAADGSLIRPKLEYANLLECYNAVLRQWRASMPHACRAHYGRLYRQFRWAHARAHLVWVLPALVLYTVLGLSYGLGVEIPGDAIGKASRWIAFLYAFCVVHNLLFLKELRMGFDRWYALVETSFTEPTNAPPVSRDLSWRELKTNPRAWFARLYSRALAAIVAPEKSDVN